MNPFRIRAYQAVMGAGLKAMPFPKPKVISGSGSVMQIPSILSIEQKNHPLIVTGPRISKEAFFEELLQTLGECTIFDRVEPDPPICMVEDIKELYLESECDCIIAIGGGSNMDAAKACAAKIARPDKSLVELGGTMKVHKKTPLLIAVPTTAGTGSECTVSAVVTDSDTHHKFAINDPVLCPDYAVLDADLTLTLPVALTAYTGMDALTHAVEAYLNVPYHKPETAGLCEQSVAAILKWLPVAYRDPQNIQARQEMLLASYRAGLAFTVACVGNVHAAAHTVGGFYHTQHGLANAVLLPILLQDYGKQVYRPLAKLARITKVAKGNDERCAQKFIEHIRDMNREMGIPEKLEMIQESDIATMASYAAAEANPLYPVPVIYDEGHFAEILRMAAH